VTTEEVHRLLSATPSKSSPFDVLPCSLLKECTETFSPVIPKLANQSMQTGKFPSRYKQAEEGWAQSLIARELQAHI